MDDDPPLVPYLDILHFDADGNLRSANGSLLAKRAVREHNAASAQWMADVFDKYFYDALNKK